MPRKKKEVEEVVEKNVEGEVVMGVAEVVTPVDTEAEDDEFADVPETEEEPVASAPEGTLYGETIVRVDNKILNGRMYKEVQTVQAIYLLTADEFKANVKN